MSARFASHEEEKGVKKTGSRKERVPTFPVQTSRSTGRDSVDSAVETHDAAIRHATKKTRFVASALFLLTGTSAFGAGAGAGSRAARTRQRRVGALSREVPDAARGPKHVPTPPPRGSASPRARSPGCENTACIPASIFFVRALRAPARDARRGEAVPGASNGSGASGGGACVATYLAEGLGHVVHGSVGVHDGVLQQTSRGVQRKGRFVVRLGGVVRALRGERPERDPLRVERAAGGDCARGGAAKGEHRTNAWGRAPLRARVSAKRQGRCRVYEQNKWQKRSASALRHPGGGTSHEPCPTNGRHIVRLRYQVNNFSDSKRATRDNEDRTHHLFLVPPFVTTTYWVVFGPAPTALVGGSLHTKQKPRERTNTFFSRVRFSVIRRLCSAPPPP